MKFLLMSAVALAFAAPAAAQTGQPSSTHQGHAAHPQGAHTAGHSKHAGHAQHQPQGQGVVDHSKHANCCGDANGKMDCCEGEQAAQRSCCAEHAGKGQATPARSAASN